MQEDRGPVDKAARFAAELREADRLVARHVEPAPQQRGDLRRLRCIPASYFCCRTKSNAVVVRSLVSCINFTSKRWSKMESESFRGSPGK